MDSDLLAVVYMSHARSSLTIQNIEALLLSARDFNEAHDVTGVLLYGDDTFFQYFEGSPSNVALVYERIRHSSLHYGLLELMRASITARAFPGWCTGFSEPPRSEIARLSQAQWFSTLGELQQSSEPAPGVDLLLDYWFRARQMAI